MSLKTVLVDVWQNGGQVVVLGGAGWALNSARSAPGTVRSHDRQIEVLGRDLHRWMAETDRSLKARQALIAAYARNPGLEGQIVDELIALRAPVPDELKDLPAGSQYHSGAHRRWQAGAKEKVLKQYRDRATEALDRFDEIVASEGWWHRMTRKRLRRGTPNLKLTSEAMSTLQDWRADVALEGLAPADVHDVSLDPELARLEAV